MSVLMDSKVVGGVLLKFPAESEEAVFKSLLLDKQYRFNPKCKLLAPPSEEHWREFVASDSGAFVPIEVDGFNLFEAELLFERKPYKAIAERLAQTLAVFYPLGVKLITPHFELQTGREIEVYLKAVVRNFSERDYQKLFEKLKRYLRRFKAEGRTFEEAPVEFSDVERWLNGVVNTEETEYSPCRSYAEDLAEISEFEEGEEPIEEMLLSGKDIDERELSIERIRELYGNNQFRLWYEEAHYGLQLLEIEDPIDWEEVLNPEPSTENVKVCPKCGRFVDIASFNAEKAFKQMDKLAQREKEKVARKLLIGFTSEEVLKLSCGHLKGLDATTVKETLIEGRTFCPVCKKRVEILEEELPSSVRKLKEKFEFEVFFSLPERVKEKVFKAPCGCVLTPKEWEELLRSDLKLTCTECFRSFEKIVVFENGLKFPCGHRVSVKALLSLNGKKALRFFGELLRAMDEKVQKETDALKVLKLVEENLPLLRLLSENLKLFSRDFQIEIKHHLFEIKDRVWELKFDSKVSNRAEEILKALEGLEVSTDLEKSGC